MSAVGTTDHAGASGGTRRARWVVAGGAVLLATLTLRGASAVGQTLQTLVPTSPYRILDTRIGTGAPLASIGPGGTLTLQVAGVGPVPADATAVIINLTATAATSATFISAWPTGIPRPTASVLNATPGVDISNMITAALGDGKLDLYSNSGNVDLVADVAGYVVAASLPTTTSSIPTPTNTTKVITGYQAHYDNAVSSKASGCIRGGPTDPMDAQVDLGLPAGATITGVRVRYTTAAPATPFNFRLMKAVTTGTTRTDSTASATLGSQINAGVRSGALALTDVGTPVSDNTYYWLDIVTGPFASGYMEFCGVSVDYVVP
jgi:hypothetical protein